MSAPVSGKPGMSTEQVDAFVQKLVEKEEVRNRPLPFASGSTLEKADNSFRAELAAKDKEIDAMIDAHAESKKK